MSQPVTGHKKPELGMVGNSPTSGVEQVSVAGIAPPLLAFIGAGSYL